MDERTINETPISEIVDIPMGGKKSIILDATVFSTIMGCPRLTDFRFNHNLQSIGGKSNSLECGSIVHKYLEVYNINLIGGLSKEQSHQHGLAAAETYIQGCKYCTDFTPIHNTQYDEVGMKHSCNKNCILKPTCGHKVNDYPGVTNTSKESDGYKIGWQWVLDSCDQYYLHYRNDHWVPLEVEIVKGSILYEDNEIRILWKAKLDLVVDTNQGIFPLDHKTMRQNRDSVSMNNQFIGQCLTMKTRSVIINKFGFQTSLKPEDKFKRVVINYSESRLLEWQSEILPYYSKLLLMYAESGYFPPNFDHCETKFGKCAFLKVCESDPTMREEEIKKLFIVGPVWNPTNDELNEN